MWVTQRWRVAVGYSDDHQDAAHFCQFSNYFARSDSRDETYTLIKEIAVAASKPYAQVHQLPSSWTPDNDTPFPAPLPHDHPIPEDFANKLTVYLGLENTADSQICR